MLDYRSLQGPYDKLSNLLFKHVLVKSNFSVFCRKFTGFRAVFKKYGLHIIQTYDYLPFVI